MTDDIARPSPVTFALEGRMSVIALDGRGVHHPKTPRGTDFEFTPYEDLMHVADSPRAIWLGAKKSVYVLPRAIFAAEDEFDRFVPELERRIAARSGGPAQLERMSAIEARAEAAVPLRATFTLLGLCIVAYLLQLFLGSDVLSAGIYNGAFVEIGDWWRLFTWNLLHAFPYFPLHLVMNALGLVAVGSMAERAIGTRATVVVMGASAIGSLGAAMLAGYPEMVGVSGVVFGLLGAVTWLELFRGTTLPAWWRVPRRGLMIMLVGSLLLAVLPVIAGLAHLGGFVFGAAATAIQCGRRDQPKPRSLFGSVAAVLTVFTLASSVVAAANQLLAVEDYPAFRIARLANLPDLDPIILNDEAWRIATDDSSSDALLRSALLLAERAVNETQRQNPAVLDTLAELQFQLDSDRSAVTTIDEAIALDPEQPYYREQRKRFTGERARDDRPADPFLQPFFAPPPKPAEPGLPSESDSRTAP